MVRINTMRTPTWSYLGLNYVDYAKEAISKEKYYKESTYSPIEALEEAFKTETYGLSEEINKENKEFRNFSKAYDVKEDRPVEIIKLDLNKENNILVSNIDINARANTESSFLLEIIDDESDKIFINSLMRLHLEENSKVKLVVVTNLGKGSVHLNAIASVLKEDAFLDLTYIEIGAKNSLVNIKNILRGDRAKVVENGVYFKSDKEYLDLLAVNEHFGKETDSQALFNGGLRDKAVKNFKGVVDLRRGCTKADGKIGDYSMMLSDEVVNKSAPILLNEEREVAGKHAASVGRMNRDMLFYIMSRGLSKKQAEALMLEANFAPALDKIDDQELREKLRDRVHKLNVRS